MITDMTAHRLHRRVARQFVPGFRNMRAIVSSGLSSLADFVLPPLCLACRKPVLSHDGLCGQCWPRVDFIVAPRCDVLGIPLAFSAGETIVSAAALADPPVYDRARAVACYDGVMRDLVHGLKYRDRHEGVKLLGRWLYRVGKEVLADADIIVPVPLARTRLWSRRFNQAAILARKLSNDSGVPDDPLALERIRHTASQVGLSVDQRKRNVAGAFEVPSARHSAVKGRKVVLVDDVITTGATANACARALKRAGATRVDVLTLARVVDPLAPTQ